MFLDYDLMFPAVTEIICVHGFYSSPAQHVEQSCGSFAKQLGKSIVNSGVAFLGSCPESAIGVEII